MRSTLQVLAGFLALAGLLQAQAPAGPELAERRLKNGIRVLAVERPDSGVVRATLVFRAGSADTGGLPPVSAHLLAAALFRELRPEDLEERSPLDETLERIEHLREALRLEGLRRKRLPGDEAPGEHERAIEASLRDQQARAESLQTPRDRPDLLEGLGGLNRSVQAHPDGILVGVDLPTTALETWLALEARRLRTLRLPRLDRERETLAKSTGQEDLGLRLILATALRGSPYAMVLDRGGLQEILRSELLAWARKSLCPERMALVLVGDFRLEALLPAMDRHLGSLPNGEGSLREAADTEPPLGGQGPTEIHVPVVGQPRLLAAWRVPPASHPARHALQILAELLGRGESASGREDAEGRPRKPRFRASTGVPGERLLNLLTVEVDPLEGQSLGEAAQDLERALLKVAEELQRPSVLEGVLAHLQTQSMAQQADAAALSDLLGRAWCATGDWRPAFPASRDPSSRSPAALQAAARSYLRSSEATLLHLEADPARSTSDPTQEELFRLMVARAQAQTGDPVKAEAIARQAVAQLLLLPRERREEFARLLRSPKGKP
ncbi:MAG: insulinase family protein [Acidobacteria bacterium]|nr:insulinase family protein [Acidobacteriota bacterium]